MSSIADLCSNISKLLITDKCICFDETAFIDSTCYNNSCRSKYKRKLTRDERMFKCKTHYQPGMFVDSWLRSSMLCNKCVNEGYYLYHNNSMVLPDLRK